MLQAEVGEERGWQNQDVPRVIIALAEMVKEANETV